MADPNDQRLTFPCYELWHDYGRIDFRQRTLHPDERQKLTEQLVSMLQYSWELDEEFFRQPVTQFAREFNTYNIPSLFGTPCKTLLTLAALPSACFWTATPRSSCMPKSMSPSPALLSCASFPCLARLFSAAPWLSMICAASLCRLSTRGKTPWSCARPFQDRRLPIS